MKNKMEKIKVLFVCVHNASRSQMAEVWMNQLFGDRFEAQSAGIEPGQLNPLVIEAMREVGVDISHKKTRNVSDVIKSGQDFSYVITVCDETSSERCPFFPGKTNRLHWGFPDPSSLMGTKEEKMGKIREIRDAIRTQVDWWGKEVGK
jgi:arsenate reductase